ncbi:MAG: hypothetical protein OXQ89_02850 [Rhodospirillaceae bacterium]|nr:hypothetical protein [Rhodospirillaceae bacterium]
MTEVGSDIDFNNVLPRQGSKVAAFEELCCQLARREAQGQFQRFHGDGGDGGIECLDDANDGQRGWQAKYLFEVAGLISKANQSLDTALDVYPALTRFVLCFPFDLTGPTRRPGQSGIEKMDTWRHKRENAARCEGRLLKIELWGASELRSLLINHDASGGLRHYFFDSDVLSDAWFNQHVQQAIATAGPRYTPELSVDTALSRWIAAFGHESGWSASLVPMLDRVRDADKRLGYTLPEPTDKKGQGPHWPSDALDRTRTTLARLQSSVAGLEKLTSMSEECFQAVVRNLTEISTTLRGVEHALACDIDARFGPGLADSPGWRQSMAEYMVSFPAAHLDGIRKLIGAIDPLVAWLQSPECILAFEKFFVLVGGPGTGKTHSVCDAAKRRHEDGTRTCIVFGHDFNSQRNPWQCLAESLGFSPRLDIDRLLDCLNAAGEASGFPLLLFIDAINETKPSSYWNNRISGMAQLVSKRSYLRLCIVCRTTYLEWCIAEHGNLSVITHRGFFGIERQACQLFFQHFDLKPPIAPVLQPELSNPLYLRLVCETLSSEGLDRLPPGWSGGGTAIIHKFLSQKASRFASCFETAHSSASTTCLMKIAKAIAQSDGASLPWDTAAAIIRSDVPDTAAALTWLVNEGLLIEDLSLRDDWQQETVLRPAFERLGDFLIASELLRQIPGGGLRGKTAEAQNILNPWIKDTDSILSRKGVLSEFAAIASEREYGFELSDMAMDPSTRRQLVEIVINGLRFRDPASLTSSTAQLILRAFSADGLAYDAAEAILSCGWRQSTIDAMWLHDFLVDVPMATRDAFWCHYLHESFTSEGAVKSLIDAVDELPLDDMDHGVAERWVIELLWFTAAADRRIKDNATRAAVAILTRVSSVIPAVLARFIAVNDDEVRDRVLLACYGAMLISRNALIVVQAASDLYRRYFDAPINFNNAVIRDHIRCICELACELAPDATTEMVPDAITSHPASTEWPPELPSDEDIEAWAQPLRFRPDEFHSDFFKYSMGRLRSWEHQYSRQDMGKWIAQRVARDFSFVGSECWRYDELMRDRHGGGRGKPVWAERIAKKYLWTALNQLASRLHDHVDSRREPWEVVGPRPSLILPNGRSLDPTIPRHAGTEPTALDGWSVPTPNDLDETVSTGFLDWIEDSTVPELQDIVRPHACRTGVQCPLLAYLSWNGAERDPETEQWYRHMWVNVHGYLVPADQVESIFECFHQHQLFGKWLPRAPTFLDGFVAEYPRGTVFVLDEDATQQFPEFSSGEPSVPVVPAWNEIICEWEYDVSRQRLSVHVPANQLCGAGLRWDGRGGLADQDGSVVFADAHVRYAGPSALLTEVEYLNSRLMNKGLAVLLAMVGEKSVRGPLFGVPPELPRRTFSQLGYFIGTTHKRIDQRFGAAISCVE